MASQDNQVTSSHATMIADAEEKLKIAEIKLSEIERLKAMEKSVRNEIDTLNEQIKSWKSEMKFFGTQAPPEKGKQAAEESQDGDSEANVSPRPAPAPAFKTPLDLFKTEPQNKEEQRKKRIKALVKKLRQVDDLKKKEVDELDADGKAKLASEKKLREELAALEAGKEYEEADEETVMLPTDSGEKDKMIKGIKKKLQQIEALKNKDGPLDAEAKAKVDGEYRLLQQLDALEKGEVAAHIGAAPEPDLTEQLMKERTEANRNLKKCRDKLEAIQKLKDAGRPLDASETAKVEKEQELKKEKGAIERVIGDINKREQERVTARLGLDNDDKKKKKNKK